MQKPIAVQRRDILAGTGPGIFGIKRMDKVRSPQGEIYTFLGVTEGVVYVERDDKSKGRPFEEIDSGDFSRWKKA